MQQLEGRVCTLECGPAPKEEEAEDEDEDKEEEEEKALKTPTLKAH